MSSQTITRPFADWAIVASSMISIPCAEIKDHIAAHLNGDGKGSADFGNAEFVQIDRIDVNLGALGGVFALAQRIRRLAVTQVDTEATGPIVAIAHNLSENRRIWPVRCSLTVPNNSLAPSQKTIATVE
tara:strand:+ start:698 stop:1084 length:387 start_codon:yes stop_codon:yes gene_type:complete